MQVRIRGLADWTLPSLFVNEASKSWFLAANIPATELSGTAHSNRRSYSFSHISRILSIAHKFFCFLYFLTSSVFSTRRLRIETSSGSPTALSYISAPSILLTDLKPRTRNEDRFETFEPTNFYLTTCCFAFGYCLCWGQ